MPDYNDIMKAVHALVRGGWHLEPAEDMVWKLIDADPENWQAQIPVWAAAGVRGR